MNTPPPGVSPFKGQRGLPRLIAAAKNSAQGLKWAWASEEAIRLEILLLAGVSPAVLIWGPGRLENLLLIGAMVLVLLTELLNTAVEAVVDRIGLEHHPLSGAAKDVGSAAVLLAMALCVFTWVMVWWP
jgi:diacylglycerol kinase (ATP)